jgi:hypothetical protein
MSIKLIDQGLNIAIASLIYGTEGWFLFAFSLYVAKRQVAKRQVAKRPAQATSSTIFSTASSTAALTTKVPEVPVTTSPSPEQGTIQISITQPAARPASVIERKPTDIRPKPTERKTPLQAISCEPVNWKQWKVSDLRAVNVAKECGVKIRPIGSRRNLTKADLIAQYDQNLKRLTKSPPKQIVSHHKIA